MNQKGHLIFIALLVTLSFAAKPWRQQQATAVPQTDAAKKGLFTVVEGSVKKKQVQDPEWIRAQVQTNVLGGDRVRTLLQSRAEMKLSQLDVIRLAPQTTIDIVKLYEETKEKKIATQIKVRDGDIWGKIKSVDAKSTFEVSSDFAGAAITGTVFRIHQDSAKQETQLKVYTGEVKISNSLANLDSLPPKTLRPQRVQGPTQVQGPVQITLEQWVYLVRSYQQITIGAKGQVKSSGSFKKSDREENDAWVKWNLQRDRAQ